MITSDTIAASLAILLIAGLVAIELSGGIAEVMRHRGPMRLALVATAALLVPFAWLVIARLVEIATRTPSP